MSKFDACKIKLKTRHYFYLNYSAVGALENNSVWL